MTALPNGNGITPPPNPFSYKFSIQTPNNGIKYVSGENLKYLVDKIGRDQFHDRDAIELICKRCTVMDFHFHDVSVGKLSDEWIGLLGGR